MARIGSIAPAACLAGMLLLGTAAAQGPAAQAPGPEAQRLASLVGSWQDENTAPPSKFGPGGKEKGTSNCEWFTGNFQVVCRAEATSEQGRTVASMMTIGWHPGLKTYLVQGIDSSGMTVQMTGTVSGNTWTFTTPEGPPPMAVPGVKSGKFRLTIVEVSPTEQQAKGEVSNDGGPWTVMMEGKSTKVK